MAIGDILGSIGGAIAGGAMGLAAGKQQDKFNKENMALQHGYNQQAADADQQRNKEMWDYTNYENQRKHMEAAGINPALMYGMSGGGGSSTAGGQSNGVSGHSSSTGQTTMQGAAMGAQMGMTLANIDLAKSQARKNNAEAEVTEGTGKATAEATIENLLSQVKNNDMKRDLMGAEKRLTEARIDLVHEDTRKSYFATETMIRGLKHLSEQIRGTTLDNDLKEATISTEVRKCQESLKNAIADTLMKHSQAGVNAESAKAISESVEQKWKEIEQEENRMALTDKELEIRAEQVANELTIGEGMLSARQKELVKDYILGGFKAGTDLIGEVVKFTPAGAATTVVKGFRK